MGMKKAVIRDGVVENIIECSDEGLKGLRFPIGTTVWDCGQYPVAIGDGFSDGTFSRDGQPLTATPTEQQQIDELRLQLDALLGIEEAAEEETIDETQSETEASV